MKLNLPTDACDGVRLESFLNGDLSQAEESEFTQHLDLCESCRRAVTDRAAEPAAWREVGSLLRPSQFDAQCDGSSELDLRATATRQPQQLQHVLDALGPTDDPAMLGRLGGYEISGIVGAGGMGVVLKAIDKSLDRTVAIKVLAPHLATSGAPRKRFAREAKAAAAVIHPNVIAIHSVSNDEALPYLVMPYLRGSSLQKRMDSEGPLSLQEILRIGAQIAAGLAAAHAQGLVHRDIKPANILLEDGVERVTITDFGLARAVDDATITHTGAIAGTPQYMSPEQARGEPVDARSDLFSLGSVLYAISTGRPPFRAETSYGVMRRITDDEPKPIQELNPDIPRWLCTIIARLMSKQAADRFASAAELSELLERCLAHVQQPAAVPLPASLVSPSKMGRFISALRPWLGVITMLAAIGFGLLGLLAWQSTEAPDIAGKWTGEEWGEVVLKKTGDAEYVGTYSSTFGKGAGELQLKWSRVERRYYGTWNEGFDRFGDLSIRLVGDEIRGAHTTDPKSKINPATPRLADLAWTKSKVNNSQFKVDAYGPVLERVVRNREAIDFDQGERTLIPDAENNPEKGLLWVLEQRLGAITDWMGEKQMDAISEGGCLITFGLKVNELANDDWDTLEPARLRDVAAVDWRRVNPRQFARAIDTVDPLAPPHVILAPRGRQRTFAFQTREGGLGILQILEAGKEGFKLRYKLVPNDAAKHTLSAQATTVKITEGQTTVVALKFAGAEGVAKVLRTFVQENNFSARIVPEPRTNALIVSAPEKEMSLITALVTRLDVSAQPVEPRAAPGNTKPGTIRIEERSPAPGDASATGDKPRFSEARFSEAKEVVLSMDGMKFMLDFDSGQTMDAPATVGRPEQKLMDVQTDQFQPYHYPKELIGLGLQGVEVKASDWDASAAEVRRVLTEDKIYPLKQMDLGPEKHPTYFFLTRDGAIGILQLLEIVADPKGIRLRYKTVKGTTKSPLVPETSVQLRLAAPEDMVVSVANERGSFDQSPGLKVPGRLNLVAGTIHRLKITNIPGRPGKELYPTVEVGPTTPATEAFLAHNAIPFRFTEEDFDQVEGGKFVTKVIYLPDPEAKGLAVGEVETIVSTRLDPGLDPILEADRRGSILAVVRIGNKDIELPKTPKATAPTTVNPD